MRVKKAFSIDKELHDEIKKLSDKTKIPVSRLIDLGMQMVLEAKKNEL